MRVL
ncbi:unnamed protein product [Acanthoscelides obtectus]|jgi:WD40 repeat protein